MLYLDLKLIIKKLKKKNKANIFNFNNIYKLEFSLKTSFKILK